MGVVIHILIFHDEYICEFTFCLESFDVEESAVTSVHDVDPLLQCWTSAVKINNSVEGVTHSLTPVLTRFALWQTYCH